MVVEAKVDLLARGGVMTMTLDANLDDNPS
jgi:hypothetical protein